MQREREADLSPICKAYVKNASVNTPTPLYVKIVPCLIQRCDNLMPALMLPHSKHTAYVLHILDGECCLEKMIEV
jgi:hypothetical protein